MRGFSREPSRFGGTYLPNEEMRMLCLVEEMLKEIK